MKKLDDYMLERFNYRSPYTIISYLASISDYLTDLGKEFVNYYKKILTTENIDGYAFDSNIYFERNRGAKKLSKRDINNAIEKITNGMIDNVADSDIIRGDRLLGVCNFVEVEWKTEGVKVGKRRFYSSDGSTNDLDFFKLDKKSVDIKFVGTQIVITVKTKTDISIVFRTEKKYVPSIEKEGTYFVDLYCPILNISPEIDADKLIMFMKKMGLISKIFNSCSKFEAPSTIDEKGAKAASFLASTIPTGIGLKRLQIELNNPFSYSFVSNDGTYLHEYRYGDVHTTCSMKLNEKTNMIKFITKRGQLCTCTCHHKFEYIGDNSDEIEQVGTLYSCQELKHLIDEQNWLWLEVTRKQ